MRIIFSKKIIKYGSIILGVIILLILILAFLLTISTYRADTYFSGPYSYGDFTCEKDNFKGHTSSCGFAESYIDSIGVILFILNIIIFIIPITLIKNYPLIDTALLIATILIWKRKIIKATIKNWIL